MITADELRELKERSGTDRLCTDYTVDTLRKLKTETGAVRVRLDIATFPDDYDIELSVFKDDKVFPFLVDRFELDAGTSLIKFVTDSIEKQESETP